ncbi:hypothetical protein COOONC_16248 [Cooperia oncophora]
MSVVAHLDRSEDIIAGAIMFIVGVVGIAFNVAAVVLIYRTPFFRNAFGYICASHWSLMLVYSRFTPFGRHQQRYLRHLLSTYGQSSAHFSGLPETITHTYFGQRIGQLTVIFWFGSVYGHLQMALNRLMAICSPLMYKSQTLSDLAILTKPRIL